MQTREKPIAYANGALGKVKESTKKRYLPPVLTVHGGLKEITGNLARGTRQDLNARQVSA